MEECRYGIHDLSRTELDAANNLPRFNMPLELGMFLGVKRGGEKLQRRKLCLVLDREPFRYQQFVSDIAGQDIRAHGAELKRVAGAIRDWLATGSERVLPGGLEICRQFEAFIQELPAWCERLQLQPEELTFADYTNFVTEWLKGRLPKPGPDA